MKPQALVALIVILCIPLVGLIVYKGKDTSTSPSSSPTPNATPTMTPASNSTDAFAAYPDPADVATAHKVILKTSKGDINLTMYPDDAPHTVKNFVTLGKRGYYNNIIFHRVIKDFVIQAGDPLGTGTGGTSIYGNKFPDEINSHKIVKGTLAMANAGANTNGSQFYIVTATSQPSLDGKYTVFGQADDASMQVVQAIASVPVDAGDKPKEDVKITGFQIVE
jgi:cyclophilin family peptidyl-prolyl cis-trans isomerase